VATQAKRKRTATQAATRRPAGKRVVAKTAKKAAGKKSAPRRAAPRKTAAKKTVRKTVRKAAMKKAARKTVRKAPARKTVRKAARKAPAKKATRKAAVKQSARKATASKATVKKAGARRAPVKKAAARKAPARKAAPRPAGTRTAQPQATRGAGAVGFIGLGTMGLPQAVNIARSGRTVVVYDANPAAMAAAGRERGVEVAPSPRAVAERCAVVVTCLPDDAAVGAVFRGEEGLLRGLRAGTVTCDLSTVSPAFTEGLEAELRAQGVVHFTGPMLGSKPQAEAGQVFYILGGPAEHLARIAPVLQAAGRKSIHVGSCSAANKIKLLHNALGSVNYAAVAEALSLCVQSGVSLQTFYEVVRSGGGMAFGNYFDRKVPTIIKGDYTPRFKLKLAHKDSQLAKAFFAETGVPAPIHNHARALLEQALAAGFGEDDASAVTKIVERRIGKPIRQD
jgi:3-hydroxyisobutyrate dehydrogenase